MATAAQQLKRTGSSELPREKNGMNRQNLTEDQNFLSSGNMTAEDFKKRHSLTDGNVLSLQRHHRPRSASLQVSSHIRRSFRGLSRSRPSSARSSRAKAHSHDRLERKVSTEDVDSSFARIKQQLAQFSEEDQVLKDRIDQLIKEMNDLGNAHKGKRLQHKRSSSEKPNSPEHTVHKEQREKIVVSTSEGNLGPLTSELYHRGPEAEYTDCGTKSQDMFLRPSESGNDLVKLAVAHQHQTDSMVVVSESESSHTGISIPSVMISEPENCQNLIGSQSTISILESGSNQTDTGVEPALIASESENTSTGTKLELVESSIPTVIVSASEPVDSDPEQQILPDSVAELSVNVPDPTSLVKGSGSSPESKDSVTYCILSRGEHSSGSESSNASFRSCASMDRLEHSPFLSATEDDVFFRD